MRHAIALTQRAWGQTHPNPLVGAVIVQGGRIVAEGWHAQDGGPHAEIAALRALAAAGTPLAADATLYVTLEPCSTHGRTGACTTAILAAGVRRVVIGAIDPAAGHAGNGIDVLRAAGVQVVQGVLAEACEDLNLIFNHRITTGTPLIAAKIAVTLDGRIATRNGESCWITGEVARADVMRWRRYFPAIAVGAGTVLADNPALTARLPQPQPEQPEQAVSSASSVPSTPSAASVPSAPAQTDIWCPRRLIFDRHGKTAQLVGKAKVYSDAFVAQTLVITEQGKGAQRLEALAEHGIGLQALPTEAFDNKNFASALRKLLLAERLYGLYVEGGSGLLSHLLAGQAIDYLFCYRAPKLLADADALPPFTGRQPLHMSEALTLANVRHASFGVDQLLRGHITYP